MASDPYVGFNMRGYNTNIPQERGIKTPMPSTYYESSFRAFSLAKLDFVRYLYTWESYERDPVAFMNELESMAKAADKWGIKVIYTNDQFRTSSWLDPQKGYGFPASLFKAAKYIHGSGGGPTDQTARQWWTDWYNRTVTNNNGTDGWTSQAQFLKKIVSLADSHKSTLGYELLNEPRLYSQDQWDKVGKYNSYLTDELRKVTKKLVVYDRQASPDLDGPVGITPENMAKMVPSNNENVIFKATLFGLPKPGTIFEQRMNYYVKAAKIAGVPLCFCEYSIKQYLQESTENLNQQNVNYFFQTFKNLKLWGWALWVWDFKPRANPNFVFVDFSNNGSMQTNANFDYILNAMGVDTANVTETITAQPETVSAPANETANVTETTMTQPETVSAPANETQTKNDSSASASVAQSGKINEVALANLNIAHSGGDFGSLQTDNISKWITSGKWNLVSTPSNSSQQNSSNIVFNATIDMRTIDNFAEHSHKLSEFKVMNSSIVNINKGINKGIIVTLNGTATLSTDSGNHTDVPIRVKIKDTHPLSINAQNGVTEYSWIPRGGVIALSIDPGKIEEHFGNTPIYGNVKKEKGNQ